MYFFAFENTDCHVSHSHLERKESWKEEIEVAKGSAEKKVFLRDFLAVLALSIHSIFEGLAIGLELRSEDVWVLYAGKNI